MPDTWTDRLSAFIDDELDAEERVALDRHLTECAECRTDLAGLREVRHWAGMYEGGSVHGDVWNGVAGAIRSRRDVGRAEATPLRGRRIRLPVALAASVVLLLVGSVSWWAARATAPQPAATAGVPRAEIFTAQPAQAALLAAERYGAAIAQLEHAVLDAGELDTATVRVVRAKLLLVDRAIREAREALAKDPASAYLADHFANMMQRKLNVLRSAAAVRSS